MRPPRPEWALQSSRASVPKQPRERVKAVKGASGLRREALRWARHWLRRLGLSHWALEVQVESPCEHVPTCSAGIIWEPTTATALIRVAQDVDPARLDLLMLHEVLHLALAGPADAVETMLAGFLPELNQRRAMQNVYDYVENLAVEDLARAIYALAMPPEREGANT